MRASTSLKAVLFSGIGFTAMAMASAASAQGTATAEEERAITVTGTRVARDGYQAPTPLTVLNQDEIQNTSPTNNIADFINQQPALAGSTRPSNSRLNISSGQAGINALTRHVASRWGKDGIRANAVAPGLVLTTEIERGAPPEMLRNMLARTRSTRHGRAEDIAGMVSYLLSDEGEWINGQVVNVDGGTVLR